MKTITKQTGRSKERTGFSVQPKAKLGIASILAPIDFSEPSSKALSYGAALAEQFDAKITLLYVSEPLGFPDFARSFPLMMEDDELIQVCKEKLLKIAKKHVLNPKLIEKVLVRQGRAYVEIVEAARALKVDLIVIATHGYSGVSHALLGSVSERVVQHAPCPVLVVREREHEFIRR